MLPAAIELTRAELYEKVWTAPLRTLAKEFGISDVGLVKVCHRHEIPLPGQGHWTRIQFGQTPERVELPSLQNPRLEKITIHRCEPRLRERPANVEPVVTSKIHSCDRIVTHVAE